MRILFVAMSNSIHTARWLRLLDNHELEVHLFPSTNTSVVHSRLDGVRLHFAGLGAHRINRAFQVVRRLSKLDRYARVKNLLDTWNRSFWLALVIRRVKPDIIHSLEIQHAGYVTLAARERLGGIFPTWIVTNWGSDIFLFGRLPEHRERIKSVLAACDFYSCECQRDVRLAMDMGLKGTVLPVLPNTGGFDLGRIAQFRQPGPVSGRRLILLKGYQHFAGRALVGLRAIELCAKELQGYRVGVYVATSDVQIAAKLVAQSTGIPIDIIPPSSHDEMLRLHGQARAHIGLSISDAISTSLLEAMVMGAFPIQSCTACADEWIIDGQTGLIVPPEDPEPIAYAIRRALADDMLVDRAATLNAQLATERLDQSLIQPQVLAMYDQVLTRRNSL